jgi:hypothetical protein
MESVKPSRWKRAVIRDCFRETVRALDGTEIEEGVKSPDIVDDDQSRQEEGVVEEDVALLQQNEDPPDDWEIIADSESGEDDESINSEIVVLNCDLNCDLKPPANLEDSRVSVVTPTQSPAASPVCVSPAVVPPAVVLPVNVPPVAPRVAVKAPSVPSQANDNWTKVEMKPRNSQRRPAAAPQPRARADTRNTRLCNFGRRCTRQGCNFAHDISELNVLMCSRGECCWHVRYIDGAWTNAPGAGKICAFGHGDEDVNKRAYLNRISG